MNREHAYDVLPVWLQNLACSLEGWRIKRRRYGSGYSDLERVVRSQWCSASSENLRNARLKEHLISAAQSPFWAHRFRQYSVDPAGGDPWKELEKLPILMKGEAQEYASNIHNPMVTSPTVVCHTSGTTGAGLVFRETLTAERERWAVWWRYRQSHGIHRDMWCGYFGGRSIVPISQSVPPFWRVNTPGRQILFSGYHLSPASAEAYLDALDEYMPPWLHGYPSLLALIAGYLLERGRPLRRPPSIVTTGAENLLQPQRIMMERAFGCPVRQHYGQSESVANISECENGHLHVDEDFSGVEFLPVDGSSDAYRVIGTNWTNPAFPLFRYDTGDVARMSPRSVSCRAPGRIVDAIDGRQEDYVLLPSGVRLGRLDHIFKDMVDIRESQIYQPNINTVVLRVVKRDGYNSHSERKLLEECKKRMGEVLDVHIEYVSKLPRSRTGKLRFVVSDL